MIYRIGHDQDMTTVRRVLTYLVTKAAIISTRQGSCTQAHSHPLTLTHSHTHTHYSWWPGNQQKIPYAPTIILSEMYSARYQHRPINTTRIAIVKL